jgi:hypothetical protein
LRVPEKQDQMSWSALGEKLMGTGMAWCLLSTYRVWKNNVEQRRGAIMTGRKLDQQ